ncbi:MAG TPA: hypothetical protein VGG04_02020 [Candidatus Sulfotelmatobacter sp.]|jgi:hypothetical protein
MRLRRKALLSGWAVGLLLLPAAFAATKVHVIGFGKWMSVQTPDAGEAEKMSAIKIRPLIVDGHVKEYITGAAHEVTDHLFVVRRVFRMNDGLPEDAAPRWQWQIGGWLMVDRVTARVSVVNLPEFDAVSSTASWYRDYVAYCGASDDGKKSFAIVAQLTRRKPVLRKPLATSEDGPRCPAPVWQRSPARVSFEPAGGEKTTFAVRGHVADVVIADEEEEEGTK